MMSNEQSGLKRSCQPGMRETSLTHWTWCQPLPSDGFKEFYDQQHLKLHWVLKEFKWHKYQSLKTHQVIKTFSRFSATVSPGAWLELFENGIKQTPAEGPWGDMWMWTENLRTLCSSKGLLVLLIPHRINSSVWSWLQLSDHFGFVPKAPSSSFIKPDSSLLPEQNTQSQCEVVLGSSQYKCVGLWVWDRVLLKTESVSECLNLDRLMNDPSHAFISVSL